MSTETEPNNDGIRKRKRSKYMTTRKVQSLLMKADATLKSAAKDLLEVRELIDPLGLSIESSILDPTFRGEVVVLKTTGGHSNTDHVVEVTGDEKKDRIRELKRSLLRRAKLMQPETRGEDRWDKPKIPGERRRRIQRDKDLPGAPPEPPPSGYLIFLGQMTCKHRHDHPTELHNQTKVVQEISKVWKFGMTSTERDYYTVFARELRDEYIGQHQEYRATGYYRPSDRFGKLQGVGPWVKKDWVEKNGLERELEEYETVKFPERPPERQEEYEQRLRERQEKRLLKEKEMIEGRKGGCSRSEPNEGTKDGATTTNDIEVDGTRKETPAEIEFEDVDDDEEQASSEAGSLIDIRSSVPVAQNSPGADTAQQPAMNFEQV